MWVVASYDRERWERVPTTFDGKVATISLAAAAAPVVWVALFEPFTYERHLALVAECQLARGADGAPACAVRSVGRSVDGRDVEVVTAGTGPARIWVVCRQHPGESMAEWWAQGFLRRLLDPADAVAAALRTAATVRICPNANPDGTVRGHLRTNARGANLNREWAPTGAHAAPTAENSPEVAALLREIDAAGCDMFLDVHGDEELPHIFLAGTQGIPGWSDRLEQLYVRLIDAQLRACPAFQSKHGCGCIDPVIAPPRLIP